MKIRNNYRVGIIGYGEVGKAVARFYKNTRIKDLKRDDGLKGVKVLNICIPWSDKFIKTAVKEIINAKPELTIIHSTVALGATKKIISKLPRGFRAVVHSPIRGVHPDLYQGIKTFVRYIGAEDKKTGEKAKKHLRGLGIKTKVFYPAKTTEALKLWDTTQYGWMILLNKEIKKWCQKQGLDFNAIYKEANKSYNQGYKKLGRPEVVRSHLKYIEGKIGGHCIIQNCRILNSEIARFILKKNKRY